LSPLILSFAMPIERPRKPRRDWNWIQYTASGLCWWY